MDNLKGNINQIDSNIYIFNGDALHDHYYEQFSHKRKIIFNEALSLGDISDEFLGEEFIKTRIKYLSSQVKNENLDNKYQNFVHSLSQLEQIESDQKVTLYFDHDMFCQINLLGIMYYLDKIKFNGLIEIDYVAKYFAGSSIENIIIDKIKIEPRELKILASIYKKVSINKYEIELTNEFFNKYRVILRGVELYLDLINYPDKMLQIVRDVHLQNNKNIEKTLNYLLANQTEYGLTDIYYLSIIKSLE